MANIKQQTPLPETPESVKQPYYIPGTRWIWGLTPSAEIWNGRLAMIGFLFAALIELSTGQGFLHFWGLLAGSNVPPLQ